MKADFQQALIREPRLPRFLCHLFQRLKQNRLNLVVGAGVSMDAGAPSWKELLLRLAKHSSGMEGDIGAHQERGMDSEYLGQILYHRLRSEALDFSEGLASHAEIKADNYWMLAISTEIYKDVSEDPDEIIRAHPYLRELSQLCRKVPLVINFNFDDVLAEAIIGQQTKSQEERSCSVTWRAPLTDRLNHTIIYHVNGILPRKALRKRSPALVFTEDSFSDAISRSPGLSAENLFLRFAQNTMLILGHSLTDRSLKNYLRVNRDKNPANHHYCVYWLKDFGEICQTQREDIFKANLELYNVITIFLTSGELNEALGLLNLDPRDFSDKIDQMAPDRRSIFRYYIVGPVAGGKSTLIEHLRCFETLEEWTKPPPQVMYKSSDSLTEEEAEQVGQFLYSELKEKNRRFDAAGPGFHFMDRAPFDYVAFSKNDDEIREKTKELQQQVSRHKALAPGQIIFVSADGEVLVTRNLARGRDPTSAGGSDYLQKQSAALRKLYRPSIILDNGAISAEQAAKEVVRKVLLEAYDAANMQDLMTELLGPRDD